MGSSASIGMRLLRWLTLSRRGSVTLVVKYFESRLMRQPLSSVLASNDQYLSHNSHGGTDTKLGNLTV